jgi:antitoxin component of MazEF toxin-antitoxin module
MSESLRNRYLISFFWWYNNVITELLSLIMVKTLTTVGNSKAVIIPAEMIKKYKLERVLIEETEDGILIRSAVQSSNFQKEVEKLRKNKAALYKRMAAQANDPETIEYYSKGVNNFSDVDVDIIEE